MSHLWIPAQGDTLEGAAIPKVPGVSDAVSGGNGGAECDGLSDEFGAVIRGNHISHRGKHLDPHVFDDGFSSDRSIGDVDGELRIG